MDLTEITIDNFKEWFSIDFIKKLQNLNMCGNLGDPIIARDTVEIYKYLRKNNSTMNLQMHTNGSARNKKFWEDLAKLDIIVVFGIDGLEDTHSKYRIATDFNKIIDNAKTFIDAGGEARWDMLVFDHNKHQTEECERLAYELGFKKFQKKNSSRFKDGKFHVLNEDGKTVDILYPTEKSKEFIQKVKEAETETTIINCKSKNSSEIYVAANGIVSPCCWLSMDWLPPVSPQRIDYIDKIGMFPNLNNKTLKDIFDSGYFDKIESTWNTKSCLKECSKQCGKFDKLGAQFES